MSGNPSDEFQAFKTVHDALEPLDADARSRVIKSVTTLLGVDAPLSNGNQHSPEEEQDTPEDESLTFASLAELFDAANPGSNAEKSLIAGYWLQVEEGSDSFTSHAANRELRNLGHKIAHITSAISALQSTKPQLVFQLKKSGTSAQSRKTFKVSDAGIKRVQEMIGARDNERD